MNSCNFIGRVAEDPILENENGARVVRFLVDVEEIRKDRHGEKKKTYNTLGFEAWDSGAEVITSTCRAGTFIGIESSARFDPDSDEVYFRINSFKVLNG